MNVFDALNTYEDVNELKNKVDKLILDRYLNYFDK